MRVYTNKKRMQRRPDVVMRKRRTCDEKSCCCSCRPSLRSQERTVLSRPPVHSFEPSEEMSMHDAPSVCPWNCLTNVWLCKSHTAMLPSEQQLKQTCGDGAKEKWYWLFDRYALTNAKSRSLVANRSRSRYYYCKLVSTLESGLMASA